MTTTHSAIHMPCAVWWGPWSAALDATSWLYWALVYSSVRLPVSAWPTACARGSEGGWEGRHWGVWLLLFWGVLVQTQAVQVFGCSSAVARWHMDRFFVGGCCSMLCQPQAQRGRLRLLIQLCV